jgi:hypothetical protein
MNSYNQREINNIFVLTLQKYLPNLLNENDENSILIIALNTLKIKLNDLPKFINLRKDNLDLHHKYSMSEITENQFKTILQKRDNEYLKCKELAKILKMYLSRITDVLYKIVDFLSSKNEIMLDDYNNFSPIEEIKCIIDYTNKCLENVKNVYKCRTYYIDVRDGLFY